MNKDYVLTASEVADAVRAAAAGVLVVGTRDGLFGVFSKAKALLEAYRDEEMLFMSVWRPSTLTHDNETPLEFPEIGSEIELFHVFDGMCSNVAWARVLVTEVLHRSRAVRRSKAATRGLVVQRLT